MSRTPVTCQSQTQCLTLCRLETHRRCLAITAPDKLCRTDRTMGRHDTKDTRRRYSTVPWAAREPKNATHTSRALNVSSGTVCPHSGPLVYRGPPAQKTVHRYESYPLQISHLPQALQDTPTILQDTQSTLHEDIGVDLLHVKERSTPSGEYCGDIQVQPTRYRGNG